MDKEPKVKKFKVEDYHNNSLPSIKMMSFGLWLAENRRRIFKIFVVLLIASIVGFFVYSAYGFLYYYLVGQDQDKTLTENFSNIGIDLQAAHLRSLASPIQVSSLMTFDNGDKVDLAVNLKNTNDKYFSSFDYCFVSGTTEISCGSSFILPGTEKYVLALAQKKQAGKYEFILKNSSWQRIDNREYPDWPAFYAESRNFVVSDLVFSPVGGGISSLSFNIENKSPYTYWEVPLNIVLSNGSVPTGVNHFVLANFNSLEKRLVNISWSSDNLAGTQVSVIPDLNVFDKGVFRRY